MYSRESQTKKARREELFEELAHAQQTIEHLEYYSIPKILKELKELKPTKREIEENELNNMYEWTSLNGG